MRRFDVLPGSFVDEGVASESARDLVREAAGLGGWTIRRVGYWE